MLIIYSIVESVRFLKARQMTKLTLPIWVLVAALVFTSALTSVRAQNETISVTDESLVNKYRVSMTFTAKITSLIGANIISVQLLMTEQATSQVSQHTVDKFERGNQINARAVWETHGETTPPWQILKYAWRVVDDQQHLYTSPWITTEMTDDTHPWKNLSDGKVRVYW